MTLQELIKGIPVPIVHSEPSRPVGRLCLDSRKIQKGDTFVALPGHQTDGAKFIEDALKRGASLIFTETAFSSEETPYVLFEDIRTALPILAARFYGHPARKLKMIGVTGTNGKTTVTHLIYDLVQRALGEKTGLIGSNHNLIGDEERAADRTTPDALALHALLADMAAAGCTHCVMEVSSHALEQGRTAGIPFDVGIFTNLSQDHLDYHGDMETYFHAKAKLFNQCGAALINMDDEAGKRLLADNKAHCVSFSARYNDADVVAKNIRHKPGKVEFEAVTSSEIARVEWATPGAFSVYNALAAVTCGLMLGIPLKSIADVMRGIPPVKGRMETVPWEDGVTVLIDYACTPDALENVLAAAQSFAKGRIFCVFGCGGDRDKGKRPLMGAVAAKYAQVPVVTTDNPRTEEPEQIITEILAGMPKQTKHITDRAEAIEWALRAAKPGDTVLLCGKGHETYQEIHGVKYPMDEREIVAGIRRKLHA